MSTIKQESYSLKESLEGGAENKNLIINSISELYGITFGSVQTFTLLVIALNASKLIDSEKASTFINENRDLIHRSVQQSDLFSTNLKRNVNAIKELTNIAFQKLRYEPRVTFTKSKADLFNHLTTYQTKRDKRGTSQKTVLTDPSLIELVQTIEIQQILKEMIQENA